MLLELVPRHHGVAEELELVLFLLEQVLEDHSSLRRGLRNQVESHVVVVGASVLIAEALFLAKGIDVAEGLAAGRVFLSHLCLLKN